MNYRSRLERVASWLSAEGLAGALLVDEEERRNPAIRYLTGHPSDALLFVLPDARTILVPWDVNLARKLAVADEIIPYTDFRRSLPEAYSAIVARLGLAGRVEISAGASYPLVRRLAAREPAITLECRDEGIDAAIAHQRAVKDADELAKIEQAAEATNRLLAALEERFVHGGWDDAPGIAGGEPAGGAGKGRASAPHLPSEADVALFIEREGRLLGAEGTSFETLAAGPSRSFGIHAFPAFGSGPFGGPGLSILDFGLRVDGYPSDVTVTVATGKLTSRQEEMVGLVEEAYDLSLSLVAPGRPAAEIARAIDGHFQRAGYAMPHSLGHGLGLRVHESPAVSSREGNRDVLEPGMVITIEPGLYHPEAGGVRKENDLLVTETGARVLTTARILRLP